MLSSGDEADDEALMRLVDHSIMPAGLGRGRGGFGAALRPTLPTLQATIPKTAVGGHVASWLARGSLVACGVVIAGQLRRGAFGHVGTNRLPPTNDQVLDS